MRYAAEQVYSLLYKWSVLLKFRKYIYALSFYFFGTGGQHTPRQNGKHVFSEMKDALQVYSLFK